LGTVHGSAPRGDSLGAVLAEVQRWRGERVAEELLRFSGPEVYEILNKHYDGWLRELLALVLWISQEFRDYGEPELGVALGENGEPLFVVVTIPGCTWDEWDKVVHRVKDSMTGAGLAELRRQVAIVCRGDKEQTEPFGKLGLVKR